MDNKAVSSNKPTHSMTTMTFTLNVQYGEETKAFTFQYEDFFKAVLAKSLEAFGIPEADSAKYILKYDGKPCFKSVRIYDFAEIVDNSTVTLELK
ncbi:hypothetical protein Dhaf_1903 [Desulfitobacterium hafniense DCB-2]|uniref:Uncharacterized protein n=2 Tax=Desulfitobacterium hafniense TaxID=49338 RepID=A0A098B5N6_DESHA|nr:hypothetical protein [Desulfitobacterium hafniense]ACL19944.1 hypothetical protein Dhaf_1903 [Desulfitobacterium hafniense DCB-2]CDX03700.1 Hypothetical protein DPCES_3814 [Desulfitobacterium hafniense]